MKNILRLFAFAALFMFCFSINAFAKLDCSKASPRSTAFLEGTACAPLVGMCNSAGYYLNCHKQNGKGLEIDCLHKLFKGNAVAGISPTDSNVASCKTYCKENKGACREEKGVVGR